MAEHEYQRQGATLTLRQGLAQYRQANPQLVSEESASPEAARFFRSHDLCHVVFGLDTSLEQEVLADAWTFLGVDIRARDYIRYVELPEVKAVALEAGYGRAIRVFLKQLPVIARVWRAARRMKRKWPWSGHEGYYDRPLDEIRDELGIRLVR
jgi:ubiquinone biosynthesis protein Coq4